jgi:hypothetical protein
VIGPRNTVFPGCSSAIIGLFGGPQNYNLKFASYAVHEKEGICVYESLRFFHVVSHDFVNAIYQYFV